MNRAPLGTPDKLHIRTAAESMLKARAAPLTSGWPIGIDALTLIHELSSTPARAADALKVLHELQVHQVELDLLKAELDATQQVIAEDLVRYKAVYDFGPVGYFTIGPAGEIIDANLAGIRALGIVHDGIEGHPIANFVAPMSQPVLRSMLETLRNGEEEASCLAQSLQGEGGSKPLRITGRNLPGGQAVLITVHD